MTNSGLSAEKWAAAPPPSDVCVECDLLRSALLLSLSLSFFLPFCLSSHQFYGESGDMNRHFPSSFLLGVVKQNLSAELSQKLQEPVPEHHRSMREDKYLRSLSLSHFIRLLATRRRERTQHER